MVIPSWDIAEFLYFSCMMSTKPVIVKSFANEFLKTYSKCGDAKIIARASDLKSYVPFLPTAGPNILDEVRSSMKTYRTSVYN